MSPDPVEIEQNTAKANGRNGIQVTGTGWELKNNLSGGTSGEDNGDCEFTVGAGNFNVSGNKANGATIAGKDGTSFPTGCVGTP